MLPKAKGINTTPGERFASIEVWIATGIIKARAPTLFITVEIIPPNVDNTATCSEGDLVATLTYPVKASTAPALLSPLLMINTAATVMTAGWPNPENASLEGTKPPITAMTRAANATKSYRQRSQIKKTSAVASKTRSRSCWLVTIRIFLQSGKRRE